MTLIKAINGFNGLIWPIIIVAFIEIAETTLKDNSAISKAIKLKSQYRTYLNQLNFSAVQLNLLNKYYIYGAGAYLLTFLIVNLFITPKILSNLENKVQTGLLNVFHINEEIYRYYPSTYTKHVYLLNKLEVDSGCLITIYILSMFYSLKLYNKFHGIAAALCSIILLHWVSMANIYQLQLGLPIIHQLIKSSFAKYFDKNIDNYLCLFLILYYFTQFDAIYQKVKQYKNTLKLYDKQMKRFPQNYIPANKPLNSIEFVNLKIFYENSINLFPNQQFKFNFPGIYHIPLGVYKYMAAKQMYNHYELSIDGKCCKGNTSRLIYFFDSKFPTCTCLTVKEFLDFWTKGKYKGELGSFGREQVYYLNHKEKQKLLTTVIETICKKEHLCIVEEGLVYKLPAPNTVLFI